MIRVIPFFIGDSISANIGDPPRDGNYLLKKVGNFRMQRHFQPPTKKAIRLYALRDILFQIKRATKIHNFRSNPICDSAPSSTCIHYPFDVLIRCVVDNSVLFP